MFIALNICAYFMTYKLTESNRSRPVIKILPFFSPLPSYLRLHRVSDSSEPNNLPGDQFGHISAGAAAARPTLSQLWSPKIRRRSTQIWSINVFLGL